MATKRSGPGPGESGPRANKSKSNKTASSNKERHSPQAKTNGHDADETAAYDTETKDSEERYYAAMRRMNEKYALILVGDKATVLEEMDDNYRLIAVGAFKLWFSNQTIIILSGNKKIELPIAETWLKSKIRRSYKRIVFDPNREAPEAYNLWRGFPIKAIKGDCSKFLAHIRDNVCR